MWFSAHQLLYFVVFVHQRVGKCCDPASSNFNVFEPLQSEEGSAYYQKKRIVNLRNHFNAVVHVHQCLDNYFHFAASNFALLHP